MFKKSLALLFLVSTVTTVYAAGDVVTGMLNTNPTSGGYPQLKCLGASCIMDAQLDVTQPLSLYKFEDFVATSSPTTPATNHARLWLNESLHEVCSIYDNGSVLCFNVGSASTSSIVGVGVVHNTVAFGLVASNVSLSSEVTSNLPVTNLNSGVNASSNTVWRGDASWSNTISSWTTTFEKTSSLTATYADINTLPAEVTYYGAKCDGSTNDTTSIQNALNTGRDVYIPTSTNGCVIVSTLNVTTAGQKVFGGGANSRIIQSGTNTKSGIFNITADSVTISDLYLYGNTISTNEATTQGWVVYLNHASHCLVKNNIIRHYGRGAIGVFESSFNIITSNIVRDSSADTSVLGAQTDIDVIYGGSNNLITDNIVSNGGGNGIGLLTISGGLEADNNTISNNKIDTEDSYGIIIYRNDLSSPFISTVTIIGNTIDNIKGSINVNPQGKAFGAGIYVLDAEFISITGNHINNTNIQTNSTQLEPAGIGLSNVFNFNISGNFVNNSNGWYGVRVFNQALDYPTQGFGQIVANNFQNHATGVDVFESTNIVVMGNTFEKISGNVILVEGDSSHVNHNIKISGNIIKGGASGIELNYISGGQIDNNFVSSMSLQGIYAVGCSSLQIVNNWTSNGFKVANTVGIQVDTPGDHNLVAGNVSMGNATGLSLQSSVNMYPNYIFNNTSDYNYNGIIQSATDRFAYFGSSTSFSPMEIVVASLQVTGLGTSVVHSVAGTLSSSQVSLSSDVVGSLPAASIANGTLGQGVTLGYVISLTTGVVGVLPLVNGGTNNSATVQDGRLVVTSSGKIVDSGHLLDATRGIGFSDTSLFGIVGSTRSDSALAGNVGEDISSGSLTTRNITQSNTYTTISTITVTAGDWDAYATVRVAPNGATNTGNNIRALVAISSFTGNTTTDHVLDQNVVEVDMSTAAVDNAVTVAAFVVHLNSNISMFLKANVIFAAGTPHIDDYYWHFRRRR